ncbi:MAG: serine hydrolase [Bacteroidota bacterium]|nr:serine hydrolase [Bacteroidota bacterium]MDP4215303.1 serine hydrolase [Bacteroidota bacterium]MDP4247214.1 serine hydrolase [Bacteroidota bacterium]MDP4259145.1 serine hydrolase [Bacteroidota bacterium]
MKKLIFALCLCALCLCGLSLRGLSQTQKASAQPNVLHLLDTYMQAQDSVNEFSGAVLVASKGKVIYQRAFGYADREWKQPNTLDTKFEICSLTKQFTAAAILQLAEEHKLSLDDKLSRYFPGYPKGDSVTLHMLLNHTSGIANVAITPGYNILHASSLTKDSIVTLFKKQPYNFTPGTKWDYSNSNYFLLGYIIEKVTGQPYDAFLLKNVTSKAGLANTALNHVDSVLANRARGYSRSESGIWKNAEEFPVELVYSAGAIISTPEDLYHWQQALWGGRIVSPAMFAKMTTPYMANYGYGLKIDSFHEHQRISHGGAVPGFTSFLGYFPADDLHIVVLSNDFGNSGPIADALADIMFGLPVETPHKIVERPIDTTLLQRYAGNYQVIQSAGPTNFELVVDAGKLYLKPNPNSNFKMELKPESETRFFFARDHDQEIEFVVDSNKKVVKCNLINKGNRFEIKKRI